MKLPIHDSKTIQRFIPQRDPIVMVDALYHYDEREVLGGLTVKQENIFFLDGCLNEPGLIEHMAQTVALHTGFRFYLKNQPAPTGYIGSIKSIEIMRLPKLGEKIVTSAEILQEVMGVTLVQIIAKIDQEIISVGEMKTVLAPE
ncbi:hypothetical protein [Vaginella massiliensis]|uniref:hypothetical protein n=1 Tax=Vaginella massiliensis TaxID=1816680 RepID=UPI0008384052|nr:hypothetical protein [Vaginella massiliensis]